MSMTASSTRSFWLALPILFLGLAQAADAPPAAPVAGAPAQPNPKPATPAASTAASTMTDEQKTLYALGVLMSRGLDHFQLSNAEFTTVLAGLSDSFHKRLKITDAESYTPKLRDLEQARVAVLIQHEKAAGDAYLATAAKTAGATRTASGLLFLAVSAGTGVAPTRADRVKVNYEGKLVDGTVFDSSIKRGQPAVFNVGSVIPCWSEALMLMKVGGKSHVVCPAALAYADRGAPPRIPPGATLVFDIELIDIEPPPAVAAPPAPGAPPMPGVPPATRSAPGGAMPQGAGKP
jgi:FKBP-type peptidyl-prolyl cis-trans isomerase FkpA